MALRRGLGYPLVVHEKAVAIIIGLGHVGRLQITFISLEADQLIIDSRLERRPLRREALRLGHLGGHGRQHVGHQLRVLRVLAALL